MWLRELAKHTIKNVLMPITDTIAMVKQVAKVYTPNLLEKEVQRYWDENGIYRKVKKLRESGEDYYFIDGPPYTTGSIHVGTAWNKILKDVFIRYLRMKGYNVRDQPGFDMHGLPMEVKVEQTLGIKNKKEIEQYGMDRFIAKCKEFAITFQKKMTEQFKALGVWLDWDDPYLTIKNDYIESAWWALSKAYERDLLMQNERVLTWCPRCETALAEAEVEYWDESDPSITVKFKVKDRAQEEYLVIWTTTPWTLPADLAVAAHPDFKYVRAKVESSSNTDDTATTEILIVLEARLEDVLELGDYKLIEKLEHITGEDLEGLEYEHPLLEEVPYLKKDMGYWKHRIVLADYVTEENTGLVHTAPGHGPDDFETGKRYELEPFCPVDEAGVFTEDAGKYAGLFIKDSDPIVSQDLKAKGLMLYDTTLVHRYGHCWRCKTPITYRTTKQWFLRVTDIQNKMLSEIGEVKWTPEWAGSSRQRDWVENMRDWCISRQRYWGIPIPLWTCSCGEHVVIADVEALKGAEGYENGMDLHRPWIDNVRVKCSKCKGLMQRIPDVLDVWFDSAVCSWAQLSYPQREDEFRRWWPCKWITEAHDQTRGWFYSQLGASVIAFDRAPYESVLMHGFALDEMGRPMSKSLGTAVDHEAITTKHGVDAFRFYLLKASAPWEDLPFSVEGVKNAEKTLNILWNVHVFATTYMALDKFDPGIEIPKNSYRLEDKWIRSRMENLKRVVTSTLDVYNVHKTARALDTFILEDLSRWYVRLIRDRTWVEERVPDKLAAYKTLHGILADLSKLLAPLTPFIAEQIYPDSVSDSSVHMCDWPTGEAWLIDDTLEQQMRTLRDIVERALAARQKANVKRRWPLSRIIIETSDEQVGAAVERLKDILLEQTNCKSVEIVTKWDELELKLRPKMEVLGKKFKAAAPAIAEQLEGKTLEWLKANDYTVTVGGRPVKLDEDMLALVESLPENIVVVEFDKGRLYLDSTITDALRSEAFARELIRRIQAMRKELDLNIEDYVETAVSADARLVSGLKDWERFIKTETRSKTLTWAEAKGKLVKDWDVEGEPIRIGVSKTGS